jgi:proteasome accessory factor C
VFIDEGVIQTGVPRLFTRPLRLTAPEGFSLLAAARIARQMTGGDGASAALDRALAKLAAVLGDDGLVIEAAAPPLAAVLQEAVLACSRLRMTYWSAHAERLSEREVTPRLVFVDRGLWYLIADDHLSGEQRTFRLDASSTAEATGVTDDPREWKRRRSIHGSATPTCPPWCCRAAAAWVSERYPTTSVTEHERGWRIELPVASERWLRELLLRLGAAATVEAPPEWADLGHTAAAELLARYEAKRD